MKKQDIEKILKEANESLGNLSDKQINQYTSESHKNQNKIFQQKGGIAIGNIHYQNSTGLFGMSKKKKKESIINGGKAAGKLAVERGTVSKAGKKSAKSLKHPNNTLEKCIHCGFETTLPLIRRWHNDNCKQKK